MDKSDSWKIFDRIAHRYDLTNRVLSWGIDKRWRKKVVKMIPSDREIRVLDLATGTGDLLLEVVGQRPKITRAVGVDMSSKMLLGAEKKALAMKLYDRISFRLGDASFLHFKDREWDYVTMAFGIRNTVDTEKVLKEIHRVLKDRGQVLILEFSLPPNPVFRRLYLLYFRYLLPLVGYVLTGQFSAYRYLNQTVESYPHGGAFLEIMKKAGFDNPIAIPLTFGIASIYVGQK